LLARLDLRFAAKRLSFALGVFDQLAPHAPSLADAGGAEDLYCEQRKRDSRSDSDGDSNPDQHAARLLGWVAPSGTGPAWQFPRTRFGSQRAGARPAKGGLSSLEPPSPAGGWFRHYRCRQFSDRFGKAQFAGKMSGEA
jgi:hypothetical protein